MIGIGINENVVLVKASITDKGWLSLSFDEVKNLEKPKASIFDAAQSAKVENDGKTTFDLNLFPFKVPDGPRNEGKTEDELLEMIGGDVKRAKNQLTQLLEQFIPQGGIAWDPYRGTGVTTENYRTEYLKTPVLETIFNNYAVDFIKMVTPFLSSKESTLRIKLIRQSKEKNFASIPGRFLEDNPWVETMDIPKDRSKIAFTKYELEQGLDSSTPVSKDTADEKKIEDTPKARKSFFGQRGGQTS